MFHMLLMAVVAIWGVSAIAVVVIFAMDERTFRRSAVEQPQTAPTAPTRTRQLAASNVLPEYV